MLSIYGTDEKRFIKPNEDIVILWDYKNIPNTDKKIIYIQVEPDAIIPQEEFILKNSDKFYKILTYNENILNKCSNSILSLFGTCWLKDKGVKNEVDISLKKFAISSITGSKLITKGHNLRRNLYMEQKRY